VYCISSSYARSTGADHIGNSSHIEVKMGRKKTTCDGCGHPSGKPKEHGFILCSACFVKVEGGVARVYTTGDKEVKKSKLVKT
jgi:ribosomal protein L37AE/L43A